MKILEKNKFSFDSPAFLKSWFDCEETEGIFGDIGVVRKIITNFPGKKIPRFENICLIETVCSNGCEEFKNSELLSPLFLDDLFLAFLHYYVRNCDCTFRIGGYPLFCPVSLNDDIGIMQVSISVTPMNGMWWINEINQNTKFSKYSVITPLK